MEGAELEGIRGNELRGNTAPIATSNDGDLIVAGDFFVVGIACKYVLRSVSPSILNLLLC